MQKDSKVCPGFKGHQVPFGASLSLELNPAYLMTVMTYLTLWTVPGNVQAMYANGYHSTW